MPAGPAIGAAVNEPFSSSSSSLSYSSSDSSSSVTPNSAEVRQAEVRQAKIRNRAAIREKRPGWKQSRGDPAFMGFSLPG